MTRISIFFCLWFGSLLSFSQETGFDFGYITTLEGKRVNGHVKNFNPLTNDATNVRFKPGGRGKVEIYGPKDLIGYGRSDDHFLSRQLQGGLPFFAKIVVQGKLSLYSVTDVMTSMSFGVPGHSSTTSYYLMKDGEKYLTTVYRAGFRKAIVLYLKEAPLVCKEIKDKKLKVKDLKDIVQRYNSEVGA
jgi:hypothetical protein